MIKLIKKHLPLILIAVVALLIRIVGTNPGYPPNHPDEPMSYATAIYMLFNHLKPDRFDYPAGVPLLHLLVYRLTLLPFGLFNLFFPHPKVILTALQVGSRFLEEFRQSIFGYREIEAIFMSRYLSAFIGGLTVPLLYFVTKKLFNKNTALFAAAFLAVNYRHVFSSHFGLPDVHNAFFSLLALATAVLLLEKNTRNRYWLAGITVGISFAIKYQIFAILPFLLVHLIWAFRQKSWRYLFCQDFIQALVLIPAVFLIINPYYLLNLKEATFWAQKVAGRYRMGANEFFFYPYFYLYHWGIGPLPSLAIVLGLFLAFMRNHRSFWLVFALVFPFFWVMTFYGRGGGFPRNFASIVPFLFIFAGLTLDTLSRFLRRLKFVPAGLLTGLLVLIFNCGPLKDSLTLDRYYTHPWSFVKINAWLATNIPADAQIKGYNIPLDPETQKSLAKRGSRLTDAAYNQGANSLAEFQQEKTDFVVANTDSLQSVTDDWREWPSHILSKYNNIPFEFIQSSFAGLTIKELRRYTVYEAAKPWQTQAYNYLVFKIPAEPKDPGKKIAGFNFNEKAATWRLADAFGFEPFKFGWSAREGKNQSGALEVYPGSNITTSRLVSPPIAITPGKFYTVKAWLKNPDGFLRIEADDGQTVALSSRSAVNGQWTQVKAGLTAPAGASKLTVSFQVEKPSRSYSCFLDEVEVFETTAIPAEKFPEIPYFKSGLPLEDIYSNSYL